jgi:hypothetical protein
MVSMRLPSSGDTSPPLHLRPVGLEARDLVAQRGPQAPESDERLACDQPASTLDVIDRADDVVGRVGREMLVELVGD